MHLRSPIQKSSALKNGRIKLKRLIICLRRRRAEGVRSSVCFENDKGLKEIYCPLDSTAETIGVQQTKRQRSSEANS
jgi:hypothetical protein